MPDYLSTAGELTRRVLVVVVVVLCAILVAVLFVARPDSVFTSESQGSLYVESYIPGSYGANSTQGNIVLVNPTSNAYSNLTLALQIDGSALNDLALRLLDSNVTLNPPNSFLQSVNTSAGLKNFSTPISTVDIGPKRNQTINLFFTCQDNFRLSPHNLTVYLSQNTFGDIINAQSLTIPQIEVYIQVVGYSPVHIDNDTYHKYYNPERP